jgi:transposase InsO family protein
MSSDASRIPSGSLIEDPEVFAYVQCMTAEGHEECLFPLRHSFPYFPSEEDTEESVCTDYNSGDEVEESASVDEATSQYLLFGVGAEAELMLLCQLGVGDHDQPDVNDRVCSCHCDDNECTHCNRCSNCLLPGMPVRNSSETAEIVRTVEGGAEQGPDLLVLEGQIAKSLPEYYVPPSVGVTPSCDVLGTAVDDGAMGDVVMQDTPTYAPPEDADIMKLVRIEGPESLRVRIRQFLEKDHIRKRFATKTSQVSALVEPLILKVNKSQWMNPRLNREPTRRQSLARDAAIKEFIDEALKDGVITPSVAAYWSQLFLTPKKNGKFRICQDLRNLNAATERQDWPLPNIDGLIQRIGAQRPKFFATFDLTAGYFQVPISKDSQPYTTFTTSVGNFMWTRMPMGLANAPGHFQRQMASKVFVNEIHRILEIYLDDLIVWGADEDEFMERLAKVFDRLAQFNLTLNPSKCVLGVRSVEFVGHLIDEEGIRFTPEKLSSVLQFRTPETQRDMRSFLGLCQYFRDHVPGFADLAAPLHESIKPYLPRQRVLWTDALQAQFQLLKNRVYNCETLYFPQEGGRFILETDASMFGIGAALFQVFQVNGAEVRKPIAFMSKKFSDVQKRWATIDQEGFAVFYAITHWDHFLRDVHFELHTDHKNLSFASKEDDSKLRRWRVALQAYNFSIRWIKGEDNFVADILSRQMTTEAAILNVLRFSHQFYKGDLVVDGVPTVGEAYKVIQGVHNATTGHLGVDATLARLRTAKTSWPDMIADVSAFVRSCPVCQKLAERSFPIKVHPFTSISSAPMEQVAVDTIGPFPMDSLGFQYVIVIIDTFTRYVELYKAKDTTALSAATALLEHFGRYGLPQRVLTDQGTQYCNSLITEFTELSGVQQLVSTPYNHSENGVVERANKEVNRHLRSILLDRRIEMEWSQVLPLVQRIINSSPSSVTGVAPGKLMFNPALDLDRNIFTSINSRGADIIPSDISDYITNMAKASEQIYEAALASQQKVLNQRSAKKTPRVATEFPVGSLVLVTTKEGRTKLDPVREGPFRVVEALPATGTAVLEYVLEDLEDGSLRQVGVFRLTPFLNADQYVSPEEVVRQGKKQYVIEDILDHKPKVSNKDFVRMSRNTWSFKVKWKGYPEPTWNNWSDTKGSALLHAYLRKKGLQSVIPKQYK